MLVRSTPDSKPAYCVEDLFVTNRTKYPTIAERFPGVPSGVALGKVLWDIYLKTKGGSKILTKYSALRKMIKTQVYRFAKLQPRVSDVDFAKDEGVGPYGGNGESDERILARFHKRVELAEELSTFLINADVTKSPRCQNMYAVMLNRATMNVIMQVGTGGSVDQAFDVVILERG